MARRGKTRYHEAGHAVMAFKLGLKVHMVDRGFKEKGAERGEGGLTSYSCDLIATEEYLAILLAGDISEERYSKVKPLSGGMDLLQCLQVLYQLPHELVEPALVDAYALANKTLEENWDLVEKVAQLMYDNQIVENPFEKLGVENES